MKKEYLILLTITAIGGLLRFWDLGLNPFWVDEAYFARIVRGDMYRPQEYVPVMIAKLFSLNNEFGLRFMFALAGTLTIPAIYFVVKKSKMEWSLFAAVFPLFVFWSRQARPYAFAGLFIVLGWRWGWVQIVAMLTTSVAIIGTKLSKARWKIILVMAALALVTFFYRGDSDSVINIGTITSSRIYYLPLLTLLLYASQFQINKKIIYGLIGCSLLFVPSFNTGKWYSNEVILTDWRNTGQFDFATNAHVASWYGNYGTWEFKPKLIPAWNYRIERGETLSLGLDEYALYPPFYELFHKEFIEPFRGRLKAGGVIRFDVSKEKTLEVKNK